MSRRLFLVSACFPFAFGDAALAARQRTVSDLFKEVKSAVGVIHTVERRVSEQDNKPGEVSLPGLGSGVLISSEGLVLTAAHVVQRADAVQVSPGTRTQTSSR